MKFVDGFWIVILGLIFILFAISVIDSHKLRRLRKNYKEEKDASKEGEKNRKFAGRQKSTRGLDSIAKRESFVEGPDKSGEHKLLPSTTAVNSGKNSNSRRKTSKGLGRIRRARGR